MQLDDSLDKESMYFNAQILSEITYMTINILCHLWFLFAIGDK